MLKKILLAAALVLLAGTAGADPQQITSDGIIAAAQSANDPVLSGMGMLRQVFGDIVDNPLAPTESGAGDTVLGKIFGVMNMSLLALGTLFLSYNITAGVAQTAADGEFLGRRFSTTWIPIRMSLGIASLVPVFKGYSFAQLVMLWLSILGVGLGNLATKEVAVWLDSGGAMAISPITVADQDFISELYRINLCMSAYNQASGAGTIVPAIAGDQVRYGHEGGAECGIVELPGNGAIAGSASVAGTAAQMAARQVFFQVNASIHGHTDSLLAAIAAGFEAGSRVKPNFATDADLQGFARQYQDALRVALRNALHTATKSKNDLAAGGFPQLGIYYTKMSGVRDYQNKSMQVQPSVIKPAPQGDNADFLSGYYSVADKFVMGYQRESVGDIKALSLPSKDESFLIREFNKRLAGALPADTSCNGNTTGTGRISLNILAAALDATGCNQNVLERLKTVGDYLSVAGWVGVGVGASIKGMLAGALAGAQTVPILGAAPAAAAAAAKESGGEYVSIFLNLMLIVTFFSLMLSVYLPLLPFVVWVGALISWVAVVIEAVVAAPLWAFSHLDTDGEGMGQKAQHGYGFIFQVLFRPLLMVIGFVLSIVVMDVVGGFFFKAYILAIGDAQEDTFIGLAALLGMIFIFSLVSLMIVTVCSNLIHVVPDTVLSWISPATAISSAGRDMSSHFGAISAGVTGAGSKLVSDAIDRARGRTPGKDGKSRKPQKSEQSQQETKK